MKKLNMRILAALLALLMFVNSCPTFAVATDPEGSNIPETTQATETPATEAPATEPPATDAAAATQLNPCGTCGKEDCDGNHTNWCAICKKDDCGVTHVLCEICQNYDCGVTHHFCDICKMYDCIVDGHGETVPSDAAEDPTDPAGADGSGEPAALADNCPWCEDTLGEDGTVIHSELCNAAYAYNGAADVSKYAKLSADAISYGIDVSANPKTDKTGKQFFDTDFEDNTILRITGWYWDSETTALWYRVGFYSGGAVTAAGWPTSAWILQKYTDPDNDYGVSLSLFSGCSICGAPECEALHVFCESCKIYDCGVDHDAKDPDSVPEDGGSDHSADIGKYLKLNSAVSSFKVYNAENGNTLTYVHDDFTGDAIMRVADWKIDDQGLWYLVEFYKGGIVESSYTVDFPANPWFLQTDGTAANTFLFMQCCATCGLPDCDGNHETETVPSVSHPSGITVSSDSGIPAGAELSVSVPSIATDSGSGIYDIKIMVPDENGNMVEWQPIDEGKTVTISIPVNTSASYVDVYHYLDYLPAIQRNPNVEYIVFEDAPANIANIMAAATAASNQEGYVAVDITNRVPVMQGVIKIAADSFSVFYYDNGVYGTSDGNYKEDEDKYDAINFTGSSDDGKTYFATRGTTIYTHSGSNFKYDNSVFTKEDNFWQGLQNITPFTIADSENVAFYTSYSITSGLITKRTINIVVMPTLTIKFESHLTDWEDFIEVPANISNIFMGNCPADQHNPAAGKYAALNYTLPAATVKAGVEGYTFKNWYVKHSPAHTFAAGQTISLSDETLQVNWDENTDSYTVTLVADFEYVPHKVTYVDPLGFAEAKTEEYLYEEPYTVQNPSHTGYTFTGWTLSTTDLVEGWTEKFATGIVPGGSSVVNMYGDVTLTANWEETSGITYQVEHWFQNAMLNGYDVSEQVDTLQGTTNDSTDAAKMVRSVVGFEVDSIENTTILGDGTAVAVIKYKRVESTIKFVDPQTGNTLFTRKGVYGTAVPAYDRPAKENYVFMGWYTADYPDQFYTPTTFQATDMTLYAKWNLVKVTITFVDPLNNNNILYVINQEATTSVDKSKIPTPTKGGYTFTGWSPEVPATMPGTSMTVAAQWTPTPYVITFDANGGTLATTTVTYTVEDNVAIPVPTRSGCTFNGWIVTSTDGSAENWASSYAGNQKLTGMYGNVKLTANWSVGVTLSINNNGTIQVDGDTLQGGTYNVRVGGFANTDVEFTPAAGYRITGVTVTVGGQIVATTFEPDGYTYHVGSDGVTEAISIVVTTSNSLTVTFKSWDGTVLDTQDVTPGGAATAPAAPAREGYSFTGWDKAFNNVTTDLVVTAQYSVNSYTVTWNFDNGDEVSNVPVTYGHAIVAPTGREKTGYQFDKWSPAIPEKMPAWDLTFKALWTPNAYTVHFDGNGHTSGTMADQSFTYDEEQALRANGFEKVYTVTFDAQGGTVVPRSAAATAKFTGWKNGDATYTDKQSVKNLTAVHGDTCTLVAQWQPGSVKLPEPTREGYTFSGWYVDADCTGSAYGGVGAACVPTQDMTLYAKWTANSYTVDVRFNADHVSVAGLDGFATTEGGLRKVVEYGTELNIKANLETGYEIDQVLINNVIQNDFDGQINHLVLTNTAIEIKTKPISYLITWMDDAGNTLHTEQVPYGATPVYPNGTPVKAATAQYTYHFTGWTPAVTPVTGPATYQATFGETVNQYTITFVDEDGETKLYAKDFDYGATPVYGGEIPTKAGNAQYSYTFAGWDKEVVSVTGQATYKATYTATANRYTVTWVYGNGTEDATVEVQYGAAIVVPEDPEKVGHTFSGWSPEVPETMPAENQKFTAQWTVNQYPITWTDDEGNTLRQHQVSFGETPVYPGETPTKAATAQYTYSFTGWTPEVVAVTGPATYQAAFSATVNKYRITFVDEDGTTTLYEADFDYGAMPEYKGDIPAKTGNAQYSYTFNGWDEEIVEVTGTATYKATYTETVNEYEVVFKDDDGSILKDGVKYPYGTLAANIQKPAEPTKASTAQYSYVFASWSPEIADVTAGATYTATYTETVNTYTITWLNDDGSVIDTTTVEYGTVPTHDDPAKTADDYTYEFLGWTPEVVAVTEDTAYTATYDARFDFMATIDHGTISYKDASVSKELERKDVVKGSDVDTQMVFKPEAGYQIKSVSINGVAQTVQLESDGSYIHTFENGMRAEEKLIEVVTEPIEVVINIQFTDGSNLLEIHVQKYSDVLLAITPKSGTTINAIQLTGSESSETTNITGVSNGYIYTATGIQESVTIVVNATSKDVFCAAASIDHGTVSIHCGDTTVTSKQSAAGNYINYDAVYTFTMTADGGRHITKVDNTIFGEYTTEHPIDGVMNAHKVVLAQTEETVHNITYILDNGSDDWRTTAAYGNVISLREAPVKSGYNFKGWWYDKDADSTVDGDELLDAGASFTMPNHGVTMTAQWLDSRLDSPHKVYVGINMSFYNSNGGWYYSLPQNEPAIMHGLVSVRAYKDTFETTTWYIQTENINGDKFTKNLPGAPSLYITEDVFKLESGYVNNLTTGGAEGIFDPTGAKTRACLKLSEADYQGIIQGWLDSSISYLKNEFPNTNLDWNAISKNAEDYTIIPYVVKRQNNGNNWFIDMVIQPSARYNITYKMNLDNGYTSEVEEFTDNTGYGQGFQAKLANPKQATNANRPNAEPRFLGWWYDKNDNQIVEDAELYGAGELFTMPAKNVELVAQWEYPKRLKITETSGNASDTFFFDVVGTNGGKTVLSMTVSVQGGGYVIIDDIFAADYTVTEKNLWSWTYETGTNAITKSVAADATADTVFEFSKAKKNVCWLFDENHN